MKRWRVSLRRHACPLSQRVEANVYILRAVTTFFATGRKYKELLAEPIIFSGGSMTRRTNQCRRSRSLLRRAVAARR